MNSYDNPMTTTERRPTAAKVVICGPCEVSWTTEEGKDCWHCGNAGKVLWGKGPYECPNAWDYSHARVVR